MANVDAVIERCVEDIWEEYDKDNSNSLDQDECKKFVMTTIKEFNPMFDEEAFSDENFAETFRTFDEDDSGTIDKSEMVRFIRKVAGLSIGRL